VELYKRYLQKELTFAPRTVESRVWSLNQFLSWLASNKIQLRSVSTAHIEQYFDHLADVQHSKGTTIAAAASNLKVFFRYAERQRWAHKGVSGGIFGPRISNPTATPKGPDWQDVCRLVESARGTTPNDCRARAILLLLSIYALRASEISNLNLDDINFRDGILTIRRSKNHLVQRLPLQPNVRVALAEYIHKARPVSESVRVFLTLRRPYGPIFQASLYNITKTRMKRLGIDSNNKGPHSLRHACANHLLMVGTPVAKVANLLGHCGTRYIRSYIQHTVTELRSVAEYNLRSICGLV
jgi:site-specific recombinase XerD